MSRREDSESTPLVPWVRRCIEPSGSGGTRSDGVGDQVRGGPTGTLDVSPFFLFYNVRIR